MARELSPMTELALQSALSADLEDAISFIDTEIGPLRALATRYYRGDKFGDEEQGRSQFVMPIVRDTARATLPSLVRIFMGSQRVVEFDSGAVGKEQMADDATDTVNYVLMRQNEGFKILWGAFKDALVRKTGWVKWWWDDSIKITTRTFTGITEEQLQGANETLEPDEVLEVVEKIEVGEKQEPAVDPATGQQIMQSVPVCEYRIRIVKHARANQVRVAVLPPEELLITRDAADEQDARLVSHRTMKTRSQLLAMGVSEDALEDIAFADSEIVSNVERLERQPGIHGIVVPAFSTPDQQQVLFYDNYYMIDFDGDGLSELRQVWAVGAEKKIVRNEPIDEVPIALFCPDPEPHVVIGLSQADNVMDLQVLTSHIWRDMLDSLKASIFPRMAYVEGQANSDDVLNTEIGAAIRMRQVGMVTPLEVPFVGEKAFGMLNLLDGVREQRTGISNASLGLDPGALQSTNPMAVSATITAAQAQVELIARIFAETGMKRLFRGILRLLTKHQDNRMQFRLNGRMMDVQPADWNPDMDVIANTALGTGMSEIKLQVLQQTAATQQTAMQLLGVDGPLCSLQEFFNTQKKMLQVAGIHDVHRYWRDPTQAMAAGKQIQPPGPTPEQTIAEAQVEIEKAKADRESLKIILEDDRERDEMEIKAIIEVLKINAQYGAQIDTATITGLMAHKREELKASAKTRSAA